MLRIGMLFTLLLSLIPLRPALAGDAAPGSASHCEVLPAAIENDIKARVAEIRGTESCEYRKTVHGKLTQAGSDDILVIYDVEDPCYKKRARPGSCGNFDVQYWAVYSRARNTYKAVAFGMAPNERIDNVMIENGLIVADVYTYAPMDPNCCPSIDTKAFFKVANARIKPIPPRGISNKARKGSATLF